LERTSTGAKYEGSEDHFSIIFQITSFISLHFIDNSEFSTKALQKMPLDDKEVMQADDSKDISNGQVLNDRDVDVAAAYADKLDGEGAYTAKEEKRLRWKLDLRLVPILWFNITLVAMDKVTTSTATLYGMKKDTDLTGNRYSWVGSAFYV
jgi:hypothetical protein